MVCFLTLLPYNVRQTQVIEVLSEKLIILLLYPLISDFSPEEFSGKYSSALWWLVHVLQKRERERELGGGDKEQKNPS